eukprot:GFUD01082564.1.p2 GENE.GFUD01082564.1~~GFUD01082564.1.p2  ORF type:complete len:132 (+),score=48.77 GFUD01082564.1:104-499(+)
MMSMVMLGVLSHTGQVENKYLGYDIEYAGQVESKRLSNDIVYAVKDDDLAKVEALVAAGENVVDSDELGQTLVHWAMAEDSKCGEKLLTFILDSGASPDSQNWYGKTPKDLAVRNDKIKLALLLLKYKVEF